MTLTKKIPFLTVLIIATTLIFSGCSNQEKEPSENINRTSAQNNTSQENSNQDSTPSNTEDHKTVMYFFWGDGCPHCTTQKAWLEELKGKYSNLEIKMFETWKNQENAQMFQEMASAYGTRAQGVPTTFIGDFNPIVGFNNNMKPDIENKIQTCLARGCVDPASKL